MKILILLSLISSSLSFAHEIKGTLILKGALKTNIVIKGIKTTCRLKVEDVKNLLQEDDFGNPAYKVYFKLSLNGADIERNLRLNLERDITLTNLHQEGSVKIVKDLEYFNKEAQVKVLIKDDGRLVSTSFMLQGEPITCVF